MMHEFSPAMLKMFLRCRAALAIADGGSPKSFRDGLRKAARVTVSQFEMAWMGTLLSPEPRTRLWGALGHVPAEQGVVLNHGGQERC